jgi:eukaryotic translation initiation factor 2C
MNVGLKVNHKLGGRNMQIRSLGADSMAESSPPIWSSKPTMLVGIDVSHPQSADPNEPSIVGLVASIDRSFAQCAAITSCIIATTTKVIAPLLGA